MGHNVLEWPIMQYVTKSDPKKHCESVLTHLLHGFRVGYDDVFWAILTHFWLFDHFDPQGYGFKAFFL